MDRQQIGVKLTIDALELTFSVETFENRLILQKAIYLAQASGVNLGYYYHWYLHGPYSPSLTKDEYSIAIDLANGMEDYKGWKLDKVSETKLKQLKALIPKTPDEHKKRLKLELLASTHYLIDRNEVPRNNAAEVVKVFRRFKKNFKEDEVKEAIKELKSYALFA